MVAWIQAVLCICWACMICFMVVDICICDQALVTAPHWSRPPMTRMSLLPHELGTPLGFPITGAGTKPFIPEQMAWHEEKRAVGTFTIGAARANRRLSEAADKENILRCGLNGILDMMPGSQAASLPVSWPGFFEPKLLVCGQEGVAALTPRGVGALVAQTSEPQVAQGFRLGGLTHLPPLLAASWQKIGSSDDLLVVSQAGDLAACPGPRPSAGGIWNCRPAAAGRLPVPASTRLVAAAAAWLSSEHGHELHAAFIDNSVPDLIAIYALAGSGNDALWKPVGEVLVPGESGARASISFVGDGELLVATDAGHVLRRRLKDGAVLASATHPYSTSRASSQWQGACELHNAQEGNLAHLVLRRSEGSQAWHPELLADGIQASDQPLFQ